jgi:hypothetical protein
MGLNYLGFFFHGKNLVSNLTKNGLGYTLGDFFTNSSGQPEQNNAKCLNSCLSFRPETIQLPISRNSDNNYNNYVPCRNKMRYSILFRHFRRFRGLFDNNFKLAENDK